MKTFVFLTEINLIGKLVHNIVCYQALKAITYVNLTAYSEVSPYYTSRVLKDAMSSKTCEKKGDSNFHSR